MDELRQNPGKGERSEPIIGSLFDQPQAREALFYIVG